MAYTADVNRWRGPSDQQQQYERPHMLDTPWHPGWIAVTILGFIIWWPVGLALLFFTLGSRRMSCWSNQDRWQSKMERMQYKMDRMRGRMERRGFGFGFGPPSSGNRPSTSTALKPCSGSRKSRSSSRTSSTVCATPRTRPSSTSSWPSTRRVRPRRRPTSRRVEPSQSLQAHAPKVLMAPSRPPAQPQAGGLVFHLFPSERGEGADRALRTDIRFVDTKAHGSHDSPAARRDRLCRAWLCQHRLWQLRGRSRLPLPHLRLSALRGRLRPPRAIEPDPRATRLIPDSAPHAPTGPTMTNIERNQISQRIALLERTSALFDRFGCYMPFVVAFLNRWPTKVEFYPHLQVGESWKFFSVACSIFWPRLRSTAPSASRKRGSTHDPAPRFRALHPSRTRCGRRLALCARLAQASPVRPRASAHGHELRADRRQEMLVGVVDDFVE